MLLQTDEDTDWIQLTEQVSGTYCSYISAAGNPISYDDVIFLHDNDFYCKENGIKLA